MIFLLKQLGKIKFQITDDKFQINPKDSKNKLQQKTSICRLFLDIENWRLKFISNLNFSIWNLAKILEDIYDK